MSYLSQIALPTFLFVASVGIIVLVYYSVKTLRRIESTFSLLESTFSTVSEHTKETVSKFQETVLPKVSQLSEEVEGTIGHANEALLQIKDRLGRLDKILHDGEVGMRSFRTIMVLSERILGSPLVGVGGFVGGVVKGLGTARRLKRKNIGVE